MNVTPWSPFDSRRSEAPLLVHDTGETPPAIMWGIQEMLLSSFNGTTHIFRGWEPASGARLAQAVTSPPSPPPPFLVSRPAPLSLRAGSCAGEGAHVAEYRSKGRVSRLLELRVMSVVPVDIQDAAFHQLRAVGALLVSANFSGGETRFVRVGTDRTRATVRISARSLRRPLAVSPAHVRQALSVIIALSSRSLGTCHYSDISLAQIEWRRSCFCTAPQCEECCH